MRSAPDVLIARILSILIEDVAFFAMRSPRGCSQAVQSCHRPSTLDQVRRSAMTKHDDEGWCWIAMLALLAGRGRVRAGAGQAPERGQTNLLRDLGWTAC